MSESLLEESTENANDDTMQTDDMLYSDESKTLKFRNRHVMLYLNSTHVLVHDVKNLKRNISIQLDDIIGCETVESKKGSVALRIFGYPKESSCCSRGRKRVPKTYSIAFEDLASAKNWSHAVSCCIRNLPLSFVTDGTKHTVHAPPMRKYLCIVNPFSGKVLIATIINKQLL